MLGRLKRLLAFSVGRARYATVKGYSGSSFLAMLKRFIVNVRNFRKDADARAKLKRWLYLVVYLALISGMELNGLRHSYAGSGVWTITFYGFIFGTGFIAFQFIRRSHKAQDEILSHSYSSWEASKAATVNKAVGEYLVSRARIIASLLSRGWSEAYLHTHPVEEGMEAITRRKQNQFLREQRLWNSLQPEELALVIAPDGSWLPEQIYLVEEWCEQLRLLRWILKIDTFLLPLSHHPKSDLSSAVALSKIGTSIFSKDTLQPSDIRPVRDLAFGYVLSIALEAKRRGIGFTDNQLEAQEHEMRVEFLQRSGEFVVDGRYISELVDTELQTLFQIADVRWDYCQYLVDQIGADTTLPYSVWRSAGYTHDTTVQRADVSE